MCVYFFVFFFFLTFFGKNVFLKIKESHPKCVVCAHILFYMRRGWELHCKICFTQRFLGVKQKVNFLVWNNTLKIDCFSISAVSQIKIHDLSWKEPPGKTWAVHKCERAWDRSQGCVLVSGMVLPRDLEQGIYLISKPIIVKFLTHTPRGELNINIHVIAQAPPHQEAEHISTADVPFPSSSSTPPFPKIETNIMTRMVSTSLMAVWLTYPHISKQYGLALPVLGYIMWIKAHC